MSDKNINERLVRIESRLVQIMLHLGMDPYKKMYVVGQADGNKKHEEKK